MKQNSNINTFIALLTIILTISIVLYKMSGYDYEVGGMIKPATYMQYSAFMLFGLLLFKYQYLFLRVSRYWLNIFIIVAFGLLMATGYEMMWSFGYWFSVHSVVDKDNVDKVTSLDSLTFTPTPNKFLELKSRNLNFISKKNSLFFFMSLYFVYYLMNIKRGYN